MPNSPRLQRLLIATDLSARADRAFDRAVQLTLQNNARLTVLHVIPDELDPAISETLKEQARKALEALIGQAMAKGELRVDLAIKGGIDREQIMKQIAEAAAHGENSVEVRIEPGSVYDIINETADAADTDIIICGVHHKLMIGAEWLGSTIDRVLRFSKRPVLIVKTPAESAYKNILVATDFSDVSADALVFAFAAFPNAKFSIVHAFESSLPGFLQGADASQQAVEKRLDELRQFSEAALARTKAEYAIANPEIDHFVQQGSALSVLQRCVTDQKIDLAVLGSHGRTGIRRAILGSVAESSIARLSCDVLAVRPQ